MYSQVEILIEKFCEEIWRTVYRDKPPQIPGGVPFPYIVYPVPITSFGESNLWYFNFYSKDHTLAETRAMMAQLEISVPQFSTRLSYGNNGHIAIGRGSPFYQNVPNDEGLIQTYVNFTVETNFITN